MNLLLSLLKPTFYYLRIRSCLNIQVDMTDLGVIHKCISSVAIFFRYFLNPLPPPPKRTLKQIQVAQFHRYFN